MIKTQSEVNIIQRRESNFIKFDEERKKISLAFEKLDIDKEFELNEEMILSPRSQETQTCQCDKCVKNDCEKLSIQSRDLFTSELINQGPEILNYQGVQHSPDEVSPVFKKDSRMWLWKSLKSDDKTNK